MSVSWKVEFNPKTVSILESINLAKGPGFPFFSLFSSSTVCLEPEQRTLPDTLGQPTAHCTGLTPSIERKSSHQDPGQGQFVGKSDTSFCLLCLLMMQNPLPQLLPPLCA